MAGAVVHTCRYAFPSHAGAEGGEARLRIATSGGAAEFPAAA